MPGRLVCHARHGKANLFLAPEDRDEGGRDGGRAPGYWMPSSSTSNTRVLFGGMSGLGLFGP